MPKPYSADLRQRAMALVEGGQSRRGAGKLLDLDKSTVILWVKEFRATGKQAAAAMGGRRRFALLAERDWLLARTAAAPNLTGRALRAELAVRGTKVSYDAGWRFLRDERLTFEKSLRAAEQDRPDVARKRERWRRHQGRVDPTRLVFVDETWAKTNMTRPPGRALRGQRLVATVPHARWTTMTFLAALRSDGLTAPCAIDGPITMSIPGLGHPVPNPHPAARRHRRARQSRQPQGHRCSPGQTRGRRTPAVPAPLQSRPQPDGDGIRQAQDAAAKSQRAVDRRRLAPPWITAPALQPRRMPQIRLARRIRPDLIRLCSSVATWPLLLELAIGRDYLISVSTPGQLSFWRQSLRRRKRCGCSQPPGRSRQRHAWPDTIRN